MIPKDLHLVGERIEIQPLDFRHAADLFAEGNDDSIWQYTARPNMFTSLDETLNYIGLARYGDPAAPDGIVFAIVDRSSGKAIGSTRYFDISERNRRLEIGWTWLGRRHWRTFANTECKLLLLEYAFEVAQMIRVQFSANKANERSCNAILRLGATYEGTLRSFTVTRSEIRDTAVFSILSAEWPMIKSRLQSFLKAK
jgi:RimJ/RimL family protein N-acetyltransferase